MCSEILPPQGCRRPPRGSLVVFQCPGTASYAPNRHRFITFVLSLTPQAPDFFALCNQPTPLPASRLHAPPLLRSWTPPPDPSPGFTERVRRSRGVSCYNSPPCLSRPSDLRKTPFLPQVKERTNTFEGPDEMREVRGRSQAQSASLPTKMHPPRRQSLVYTPVLTWHGCPPQGDCPLTLGQACFPCLPQLWSARARLTPAAALPMHPRPPKGAPAP